MRVTHRSKVSGHTIFFLFFKFFIKVDHFSTAGFLVSPL